MGYLSDLRKRLQQTDFHVLSLDCVAAKDSEIADYVRQQIIHGQTANATDGAGTYLGQYMDEDYATEKYNQGLKLVPFGYKDMYRTGEFTRKITTSIVGDEIITESTDPKAAEVLAVEQEFSDVNPSELFNLNGEYKRRYINTELHPEFKKQIEKATGLRYGK